jgi:hypothetical protein
MPESSARLFDVRQVAEKERELASGKGNAGIQAVAEFFLYNSATVLLSRILAFPYNTFSLYGEPE